MFMFNLYLGMIDPTDEYVQVRSIHQPVTFDMGFGSKGPGNKEGASKDCSLGERRPSKTVIGIKIPRAVPRAGKVAMDGHRRSGFKSCTI